MNPRPSRSRGEELRSIDLNADLATSVNIACGFNAGDPETVATCLSVLGVIVTRGYESQ